MGSIFILFGFVTVKIQTDSKQLISDIQNAYCGLTASKTRAFSLDFNVEGIENSWQIYFKGRVLHELRDYSHVFPTLEWWINTTIYKVFKNYIQIHGVGLTKNKKSILILGKSGSGKSTTALSLIENGFSIFSEDMILLDSKSNKIVPHYKPLCFKGNQPAIVQKYLNQSFCLNALANHYHYISPQNIRKNARGKQEKVILAIFLKQKEGQGLEIKKLNHRLGINSFTKFIVNRDNLNFKDMTSILSLCQYTSFFKINWSDDATLPSKIAELWNEV